MEYLGLKCILTGVIAIVVGVIVFGMTEKKTAQALGRVIGFSGGLSVVYGLVYAIWTI